MIPETRSATHGTPLRAGNKQKRIRLRTDISIQVVFEIGSNMGRQNDLCDSRLISACV